MKILRYNQLSAEQRLEADTLLRETMMIHNHDWHCKAANEITDRMMIGISTVSLCCDYPYLCLVNKNGYVVSILYVSIEYIDGGPFRGTMTNGLLWCCTRDDYRRKGMTEMFHALVINEIIKKTNPKLIPITVDVHNEAAKSVAKKLAHKFPNIVRVEIHDKEKMIVSVYVSNGKDLILEWTQPQTAVD